MRGVPKGNRPIILTYHDIGLNRESAKKRPETMWWKWTWLQVHHQLISTACVQFFLEPEVTYLEGAAGAEDTFKVVAMPKILLWDGKIIVKMNLL